MTSQRSFDYIIVGSGIAGLYTALLAREHGSVLIVTKGAIDESNTKYAQGGIAAAVGPGDSTQRHFEDTVSAGAGLVDVEAARILTEEAPARIADLVRFGVLFDKDDGVVALAREGAHSVPRVLHAGGDSTGAHIELSLSGLALQSGITVREHCLATEIVLRGGRACGLRTIDFRTGEAQEFACRCLILASGGAGNLYRATTNPAVATGDGIALAYDAGAEIADMEFYQFHPTALRLPGVQPFLISEALRGEGGVLRDLGGHRFMPDYHPLAELAPRDIVARAIAAEMATASTDHVVLDVTHLSADFISERFPQIYNFCLAHGLDITKQPIPVSPAAHYLMGGVRTNVWGETCVAGLYACGEVACTSVHGANRLASNSLLETVVFGKRVVERTLSSPQTAMPPAAEALRLSEAAPNESPGPTLGGLQALMWDKVGIVRNRDDLACTVKTLRSWQAAKPPLSDRASHELASLITCAKLASEAALMREESRGAHYRSDFPDSSEVWRKHIIFRKDGHGSV